MSHDINIKTRVKFLRQVHIKLTIYLKRILEAKDLDKKMKYKFINGC